MTIQIELKNFQESGSICLSNRIDGVNISQKYFHELLNYYPKKVIIKRLNFRKNKVLKKLIQQLIIDTLKENK
jgi:hypothetical protein